MSQMLKNLPAMQELQVQSLGWEDPQEKGMATHSSILTWRTPWTEEPGGLQSIGLQRVEHDWVSNTSLHAWAILFLQTPSPKSGKHFLLTIGSFSAGNSLPIK